MDFYRRYSLVIGLFVLAGIIVILLSTPGAIFSKGVSFIDTEINLSSGVKTYVETKLDFADNEHVQSFPKEFGDWQGLDYDTTKAEGMLGTDVMLLRAYYHPGYYQSIFLLISQAKTESNFHSPPVCYQAQGYEIEEEGREEFTVSATSWAQDVETEDPSPSISIPVKKLVVSKGSERRVVLYFYVEGNQFTSDTITMIRVEALAPIEGSYEGILQIEKEFAARAFPYMFEPSREAVTPNILAQLTGTGLGGYLAIALLLSIPMAIVIYPQIRRKQISNENI